MDDTLVKRHKTGKEWVKLQADNYEAIVSVSRVLSYPSSCLATQVQFELAEGSSDPAVRLDCDAEEAKEIVALLRQGSHYKPPMDNPRLLQSLRHTLDFLGLPIAHFPSSSHSEVLLLPAYVPHPFAPGRHGLLMYSGSTQGWAAAHAADPVPGHVWSSGCSLERRWLTAVLRSEHTSAGEDLVFMLPHDIFEQDRYDDLPVLLRASLKASSFRPPSAHWHCAGSALTAADGKLYLFGGEYLDDEGINEADPSRLEVFDPHTGAWYTASSPLPEQSRLLGHALLSNTAGGILLALGGKTAQAGGWNSSIVAKHDIKEGSWVLNPSGCTLPQAAGASSDDCSVAAVAADEHTIMLLRATRAQRNAEGHTLQDPGRVDLLDLRMWRWREGAALQRDFLHGVGLVEYDDKLLAVGGCADAWQHDLAEQLEALSATAAVSSYDLRTDSWSVLPARLPVALSHASPVMVRMPAAEL